jgi:hypothetical protein
VIKKHKLNRKDKEYIPMNPHKYCGSYPIICRSTWEQRMCGWFDFNKDVLEWSSEGHRIRYIDPTTGKNRIYYPDFYVMFKNRKKFIVEVKPLKDIRMPKRGKKSQRTLMIYEQTISINQAKFKAAKQYCKKLGMEFIVLTEKDLFRGN